VRPQLTTPATPYYRIQRTDKVAKYGIDMVQTSQHIDDV
jgi:hypothetical protein